MDMNTRDKETRFSDAVAQAMKIRKLYNELEKQNHGEPWTNQEDMLGFVHDVGELGRLVMAAEGRWVHQGDMGKDLGDKMADCLWWLFVLSERLGVDISAVFSSRMNELEDSLSTSAY